MNDLRNLNGGFGAPCQIRQTFMSPCHIINDLPVRLTLGPWTLSLIAPNYHVLPPLDICQPFLVPKKATNPLWWWVRTKSTSHEGRSCGYFID